MNHRHHLLSEGIVLLGLLFLASACSNLPPEGPITTVTSKQNEPLVAVKIAGMSDGDLIAKRYVLCREVYRRHAKLLFPVTGHDEEAAGGYVVIGIGPSTSSCVSVFRGHVMDISGADPQTAELLLAIEYVFNPAPMVTRVVWAENWHEPPNPAWDYSGQVLLHKGRSYLQFSLEVKLKPYEPMVPEEPIDFWAEFEPGAIER